MEGTTGIPTFTVSSLTGVIRSLLEEALPLLRVEGEIGTFNAHRSGHWYLTLKDDSCVLNAVMFRGANRGVRWSPRPGDRVLAVGSLDVYGPAGRYNLVIRQLLRAGDGDLQARLEALKRKLAAEGLFDPGRKRRLPPLPRAVGVATSPTGAAFQDVLRVVRQRFPGLPILLAPCRVQGEGAAEEVARALRLLERHGQADVIIVGRGGGSAEDLMAFNEEVVVRAVAACGIPVVSAVGHEVDVSLCDLAADVRAATPSHAAELVVPERDALLALVDDRHRGLVRAARRRVADLRRRLGAVRLKDPRRRVVEGRLRCDELEARLHRARTRLVADRRRRVEALAHRLDALSPLRVLERGYAIALHDEHAVRDAARLQPGEPLVVRLHRGRLATRVVEVQAADGEPEPSAG